MSESARRGLRRSGRAPSGGPSATRARPTSRPSPVRSSSPAALSPSVRPRPVPVRWAVRHAVRTRRTGNTPPAHDRGRAAHRPARRTPPHHRAGGRPPPRPRGPRTRRRSVRATSPGRRSTGARVPVRSHASVVAAHTRRAGTATADSGPRSIRRRVRAPCRLRLRVRGARAGGCRRRPRRSRSGTGATAARRPPRRTPGNPTAPPMSAPTAIRASARHTARAGTGSEPVPVVPVRARRRTVARARTPGATSWAPAREKQ